MLPSFFLKETKNPSDASPISPDEKTRPSVARSYHVMSSGLWVLGGIFAFVFGGLILLIWGIYSMTSSGEAATVAASHSEASVAGEVYGSWTGQQPSEDSEPELFDAQKLVVSLNTVMNQHPQTLFGIVVAPIGSGNHVRINDDKVFTAASTTKILTAAAVLSGVDAGKYSFDQIAYQIVPKTEDEDKPAEETSKNPHTSATPSPTPTPTPTPEPKKVSVKEALRLMINRSDNQAWEHLIKLVGSKNLQKYADDLGMQDYDVRENQASARDLALLLQKLYSQQLVSESSTKLLLSWMQDTNQELMIPAGMDEVGEIYHKYGWLGANLHDVAVVDNHGAPVVVVLMTTGSQSYAEGKDVVRQLAEVVEQALLAGSETRMSDTVAQ